MSSTPSEPPATTPRKKPWLVALKVIVSIALLAWVVRSAVGREGIDALVARIAAVDVRFFALAVLLQLTAVIAGTLRWQVLIAARGHTLPLPWLFRRYLVGRFFGAFMPSTTGLDLYRAYAVARATRAPVKGASTILAEKLAGLISMSIVCASLAPLGASRFFGIAAYVVLALVFVLAAAGLYAFERPARARGLLAPLPAKLRTKLEGILEAAGSERLRGARLAKCIGFGVVAHLAQSSVFVATGLALGVAASPLDLLVVGNAIVVGILVPISIGGLGVREGIAVVLLGTIGVGAADATLVALLGWLSGQLVAAIGGIVNLADRHAFADQQGSAEASAH